MALSIRILIDECLSPVLAESARSRGIDAWHVNHLGLNGASDPVLFRRCQADDFAFVTNNARDFLPMYEKVDLHAGLVLLPGGAAAVLAPRFTAILELAEQRGDLVNCLVDARGSDPIAITPFPR